MSDQSPIGTQIGPYVVHGLLGVGGMGAVYRGRDSRLGRDVAIKILPAEWRANADRRTRFNREARVLAALNHPNIGHIYGIEENAGTPALVLELVEGPTLAERIGRIDGRSAGRGLPLDEALAIARQITDALEAAHERGIIHRDLKPENIKLTADGRVKVLDFGLATSESKDEAEPEASLSPTFSIHGTQHGSLLGTAAYMSPEQARGLPVDKRADIWAFGCVLYELLTGRQTFGGPTMSDRVASILDREPAWDALPETTPAAIVRVLHRCLDKDAKRRLRDIGDARIEIEDALATSERDGALAARGMRRWSDPRTIAVLVLTGVTAGVVGWWLKPTAKPQSVARPSIARLVVVPVEPLAEGEEAMALSPDGRRVAYIGGARRRIFVREIDQFESTPVAGTEGADGLTFSPDGRSLAFIADQKLKRVSLAGGAPLTLREWVLGRGLDWSADDSILFNPGVATGIWRVRSGGETATALTKPATGDDQQRYPELLPGGKALLVSAFTGGGIGEDVLYVYSLETGQRRQLGKGVGPHYLPTGHLVYVRAGSLYAVPFDPVKLEPKGNPVVVLDGVRQTAAGTPQISFSRSGSMAYVAAGPTSRQRTLVWVDRTGAEEPVGTSDRVIAQPRLAPDGRRLAVAIKGESDLWQYDLARETWTRLTFEGSSSFPVWTPDGRSLTFSSGKAGPWNMYSKTTDGSGLEERLSTADRAHYPFSWSPDGRTLAFVSVSAETAQDIWLLESAKARPFLQTPFREGAPAFSPDGRWMVYVSDESGRAEIYVRPFPGPGENWTVSAGGGMEPVWPKSGRQLFYRNGDAMMVADVTTSPTFSVGRPRRLFEKSYERSTAFWPNYDVSADGERLLMIKGDDRSSTPAQISVVVNWLEELKERVPVR